MHPTQCPNLIPLGIEALSLKLEVPFFCQSQYIFSSKLDVSFFDVGFQHPAYLSDRSQSTFCDSGFDAPSALIL